MCFRNRNVDHHQCGCLCLGHGLDPEIEGNQYFPYDIFYAKLDWWYCFGLYLAIDFCRYFIWGLVILVCWQQIGYMMIIYIAGLQSIPGDVLEAAEIDGATNRQKLFKVTIPMMMPSITICTFLSITNGFKLFDQNLALTAGEPGKMSELMALNIFNTFYGRSGFEGVGQAKAVIFFIIVVGIGLIQLRATRSKEVQQ